MQSNQPDQSDPWPHDMVLTIINDSDVLLQLLWIRQAWDLRPSGDDWPPLLTDLSSRVPVEGAPTGDRRTVLTENWGRIWIAALDHAGNRPSPHLLEEARTASTPSRRAELLAEYRGPSWHDGHDDSGFGQPYTTWREDLLRALIAEQHDALEHTPERQSLPALIDAWRRGLHTIVTIPTPGTYTRTLGQHGLLVTAQTRADPACFSTALHAFQPR